VIRVNISLPEYFSEVYQNPGSFAKTLPTSPKFAAAAIALVMDNPRSNQKISQQRQ
jgi:hypothetical protein